jgi:hypothetical protein
MSIEQHALRGPEAYAIHCKNIISKPIQEEQSRLLNRRSLWRSLWRSLCCSIFRKAIAYLEKTLFCLLLIPAEAYSLCGKIKTDLYSAYMGADKAAEAYFNANMHWQGERCLSSVPVPSDTQNEDMKKYLDLLFLAGNSYSDYHGYDSEYRELKLCEFGRKMIKHSETLSEAVTGEYRNKILDKFLEKNAPQGAFDTYVLTIRKVPEGRGAILGLKDPILQKIFDKLIAEKTSEASFEAFFNDESEIPFPVVFEYVEKLNVLKSNYKAKGLLETCKTALLKTVGSTNPNFNKKYPNIPFNKSYLNERSVPLIAAAHAIGENKKFLIDCAVHFFKIGCFNDGYDLLKNIKEDTTKLSANKNVDSLEKGGVLEECFLPKINTFSSQIIESFYYSVYALFCGFNSRSVCLNYNRSLNKGSCHWGWCWMMRDFGSSENILRNFMGCSA